MVANKDVEMPKSCGQCDWFNHCSAIDVYKIMESGVRPDFTARWPNCPLVVTYTKEEVLDMFNKLAANIKEYDVDGTYCADTINHVIEDHINDLKNK